MGAARMILNSKLKGEFLARDIKELYMHETLRADMQRNSRALGRPDAGAKAVDIAMSLIKQSSVNSVQAKGER